MRILRQVRLNSKKNALMNTSEYLKKAGVKLGQQNCGILEFCWEQRERGFGEKCGRLVCPSGLSSSALYDFSFFERPRTPW